MLHTRGIVFRTIKYAETSVITDIFTEDKGLHAFIAGSVRAAKSKMPYSFFQPMMAIDMIAYYQEGKNGLHRIKEVRPAFGYQSIPFDLKKGAIALFMAEVCQKSIKETEENNALFEFLLAAITILDATEKPVANFHLSFLIHLAGHLGFLPEGNTHASGWFDLREGVFSQTHPPHIDFMSPELSTVFAQLLELPFDQFYHISVDLPTRKGLLAHILKFYSFHVPGFGKINTTEVLESVFNS